MTVGLKKKAKLEMGVGNGCPRACTGQSRAASLMVLIVVAEQQPSFLNEDSFLSLRVKSASLVPTVTLHDRDC